jgi:glucose-6-phosphate 1-dehydrogenase
VTAPAHSDALVVFGASGDLAYKKIFPALYAMVRTGALNARIVGVAKSAWTLEQLRARARESVEHSGPVEPGVFDKFCSLLRYSSGDFTEGAMFDGLRRQLGDAKRPLHYLAIPPSAFSTVVDGLGRSGCGAGARVAVEKPFGRDLASARTLNETLHRVFPERSIFRIDHYLGKEPVLNLLYFRFSNRLLESLLNRDHVASVQITMAESFGVQGRGRFYEETGVIRDVIQNHLLQVTAILAMDPPVRDDVEAIRDEKTRVLNAVAPLDADHVVRGQFRGYRDEEGVARDSKVETFAAIELRINTWRWADVPFFIRAGKCLAVDAIEVLVQFKEPPRDLYSEHPSTPAYFRFRVGPDLTALALGLRAKRPGEAMVGRDVELLASQHQADDMLPYERLLGDAMRGDPNLFARQDSVEAQWRIVDPILEGKTPLREYEPGTWGPPESDRLVATVPGGWVRPMNTRVSS